MSKKSIIIALIVVALFISVGFLYWWGQKLTDTQQKASTIPTEATKEAGKVTGATNAGNEIKKIIKSSIKYSVFNKDCMNTEFVAGFKEDTSADYYTRKDSCAFQLTYEDNDHFALLKLDQPLSATVNRCGSGEDVWQQEKSNFTGNILQEGASTINGASAYRVFFEDGGYKYVDYYICFGQPKYKWGEQITDALFLNAMLNDSYEKEVMNHVLSTWRWK